jgi:hypothetical protein
MFIGRTSFTLVVREKRKTPDSLAPIRVATPSGCRKRRRPKSLFFPCSGNGNGSSWNNRGSNGNYWSSSLNSATNGRNLNFNSGGVNPQNTNNRFNGFAGRAVQHSILNIPFFFSFLF